MYTFAIKWEEVEVNGKSEINSLHIHKPVLVEQVCRWLACQPGGRYLDCTVGGGGHAWQILDLSRPDGILIGIDRDEAALAVTRERVKEFGARATLLHGHFSELAQHLHTVGVSEVDGVLFDLGVSSTQLGCATRGFSFSADGPLDMRMDQRSGQTAADLVNQLAEPELADLVYRYGEERYARRIARAVVRARARGPLRTTFELAAVIWDAVPASYRHGRLHCATRTFQALRIAVNRELDSLADSLRDATRVLAPGGRLCVISFHSLEDRIAKQTLRALSHEPGAYVSTLTKKPVRPSEEELRTNPRARSAKLRVAERLPEGRLP